MSSTFSDVFPPALPFKSPPPFQNSSHQGFRTPQYILGWVIRASEAAALFNDGPRRGNPISLVACGILARRWPEAQSKYAALKQHSEVLSAPSSVPWDSLSVIVYICSNSFPSKMNLVIEHQDEVVQAAMEAIGFSSERVAELKWHRRTK